MGHFWRTDLELWRNRDSGTPCTTGRKGWAEASAALHGATTQSREFQGSGAGAGVKRTHLVFVAVFAEERPLAVPLALVPITGVPSGRKRDRSHTALLRKTVGE